MSITGTLVTPCLRAFVGIVRKLVSIQSFVEQPPLAELETFFNELRVFQRPKMFRGLSASPLRRACCYSDVTKPNHK
jgi:hypothetical protein